MMNESESGGYQHEPSQQASTTRWVQLGLVLLVLVVYGQVVGHEFIMLDDNDYVYENSYVRRGLSWSGVQWAFTHSHVGHWHPLTWISLMLDAQIYGQPLAAHSRPAGGFHLTNVILHAANVLLLLTVLRRMTGALWPSAMVAALFAVHPLHVESVAWVTERKDVLRTTFWMLTLLAYAAYAQRGGLGRYLLVALFLALGLMAKPMLVTLPCVLLLLDFWPLGRLNLGQKLPERRSILTRRTSEREPSSSTIAQAITSSHLEDTRRRQVGIEVVLVEKLPLLALSASASVIATLSQRSAGALGTLEAVSWSARLTNAFIAYVGYLWKMIWPVKLACYYPHSAYIHRDVSSSLSATVIASVLMLAIITYFVFYSVWRRPYCGT